MSPRLSQHRPEPYVAVHPDDAAALGFSDGDLVMVKNDLGEVYLRFRIDRGQRRGSIFVPMHWNSVFASNARIDTLVPAVTDPLSGQPESKHAVARIAPCQPLWQGFILTRRNKLNLQYSSYWARSRRTGLWHYEIAGRETPADWAERAHALLSDENDGEANWVEFFDRHQHHYRAARFIGDHLESCIFIGKGAVLPERDWLISLFLKDKLEKAERQSLLTGQPPTGHEDVGRIVCACFNVGEKTIRDAIRKYDLKTPEAIGETLQAGTNCGSCITEMREILPA
jgi:assimilatory nitrate reductase catalytic subunit